MAHSQQQIPDGDSLSRHRLAPRRAAGVLLSLTTLVALTVLVTGLLGEGRVHAFLNPDGELTLPAFYSGALLVVAGVIGVYLATEGLVYLTVGIGMLFMAVDEIFSVHERLEVIADRDWQVIYVPAFLVGTAVLVVLFRRTRHQAPPALPWLTAGTVCWVVSQLLEAVQWEGDVQRTGYRYMMFAEEILEMVGTVGFLIALVAVACAATDTNEDRLRGAQSVSVRRPGARPRIGRRRAYREAARAKEAGGL